MLTHRPMTHFPTRALSRLFLSLQRDMEHIDVAKMQLFMGDLPIASLTELAGRAVADRVVSGRVLAKELQPHLSCHVAPHLKGPQFCQFVRSHGKFISLEDIFDESTMQRMVAKLLNETLRDRGAHEHNWQSEYHINNDILKHLQSILGEFVLDLAMKMDFPRMYLAAMGVQHKFPMYSLPKTARSLFVLSPLQSNDLYSWCPPPDIHHLSFPLGYKANRQHPEVVRDRSKHFRDTLFLEGDDEKNTYFLYLHRMVDAGLKERFPDVIAFGLSAFDARKDESTVLVLCHVAVACAALKMEFLLPLSLVQHALSLVRDPFQLQHISLALQQVYLQAGLLDQEGELFHTFKHPLRHNHLFAQSIVTHLRTLTEKIENHIGYRRALHQFHYLCTECGDEDDVETTERLIDQMTCVIKAYEYVLDLGTVAFFEGMAKLLRMASQMATKDLDLALNQALLVACYKHFNKASFWLKTNNVLRYDNEVLTSIAIMLVNPDAPEVALERLRNAVKALDVNCSSLTRMKHSELHIRNLFRLVLFSDIFSLVPQQDLHDFCGSLKHQQLGFEGLLRGYRQSLLLRYIAVCEGQRHFNTANPPLFINEDLLSGLLHDKMAAWRFELNLDREEEEEETALEGGDQSPSLLSIVSAPVIADRAIDYIHMDRARMKDAIMFSYESHVKHGGL